jgi:hypothetical protein
MYFFQGRNYKICQCSSFAYVVPYYYRDDISKSMETSNSSYLDGGVGMQVVD